MSTVIISSTDGKCPSKFTVTLELFQTHSKQMKRFKDMYVFPWMLFSFTFIIAQPNYLHKICNYFLLNYHV